MISPTRPANTATFAWPIPEPRRRVAGEVVREEVVGIDQGPEPKSLAREVRGDVRAEGAATDRKYPPIVRCLTPAGPRSGAAVERQDRRDHLYAYNFSPLALVEGDHPCVALRAVDVARHAFEATDRKPHLGYGGASQEGPHVLSLYLAVAVPGLRHCHGDDQTRLCYVRIAGPRPEFGSEARPVGRTLPVLRDRAKQPSPGGHTELLRAAAAGSERP